MRLFRKPFMITLTINYGLMKMNALPRISFFRNVCEISAKICTLLSYLRASLYVFCVFCYSTASVLYLASGEQWNKKPLKEFLA